jgi:type II secretory pathway component GspD/PulD (secretin)
VERRLRASVNLDYKDAPLRQVVKDLGDHFGLNVIVDRLALEQQAVSLDTPVNVRLKDVSLKAALTLILRDVGLTHCVEGNVLLVTTPAGCQGRLVRKVYAVGALVGRGREAKGDTLVRLIMQTVEPSSWAEEGGAGRIAYFPEGKSLVVVQSAAIQAEVQGLLEDLRTAKQADEK